MGHPRSLSFSLFHTRNYTHMLGISLLSKAASIVLLAGITYASPVADFIQRPIGSPNNALNDHHEGLMQHHCGTFSSESQDRDKFTNTWLSSLHPGLPEHSIRYKTPDDGICDPSVKQVSWVASLDIDGSFSSIPCYTDQWLFGCWKG